MEGLKREGSSGVARILLKEGGGHGRVAHGFPSDVRFSFFSGMSVLTLALCARLSWLLVSF